MVHKKTPFIIASVQQITDTKKTCCLKGIIYSRVAGFNLLIRRAVYSAKRKEQLPSRFRSKPASTQRVAKVCLRAWKLTGRIPFWIRTFFRWFSRERGSTNLSLRPVRKNTSSDDRKGVSQRTRKSGSGMVLKEQVLFGVLIMMRVRFPVEWLISCSLCSVRVTKISPSVRWICPQVSAQSSPIRIKEDIKKPEAAGW